MTRTAFRFAASIGISLLLHAGLLAIPESPSDQPAPRQAIEARLAPPPAGQPLPLKKSGKPVVRSAPSQPEPERETRQAVAPTAPEASPENVPETAQTPEAPEPTGTPLPERVEIRYGIFQGTGELRVGQASQRWQREGANYTISQTSEASGLVSLFYSGRHTQHSQGEITAAGLRPGVYRVERGQPGKMESAEFDWAKQSLSFNSGQRTVSLPGGAQDLLSLLYQLALFPPEAGKPTFLPVTNGRKLGRYGYELAGEETLALPVGLMKTLRIARLRQEGEENTEIWLATEYHYLPVKIRHTDKQGNIVEQQAAAIQIPVD